MPLLDRSRFIYSLAGMLSAMVVSGVLSRRNVRGVRCGIEAVGEVVATRPAWLKLKLENELSADGTTIAGVTSSIQGGVQVEFRKR